MSYNNSVSKCEELAHLSLDKKLYEMIPGELNLMSYRCYSIALATLSDLFVTTEER